MCIRDSFKGDVKHVHYDLMLAIGLIVVSVMLGFGLKILTYLLHEYSLWKTLAQFVSQKFRQFFTWKKALAKIQNGWFHHVDTASKWNDKWSTKFQVFLMFWVKNLEMLTHSSYSGCVSCCPKSKIQELLPKSRQFMVFIFSIFCCTRILRKNTNTRHPRPVHHPLLPVQQPRDTQAQ